MGKGWLTLSRSGAALTLTLSKGEGVFEWGREEMGSCVHGNDGEAIGVGRAIGQGASRR